jgi:triacylglycerol lipase
MPVRSRLARLQQAAVFAVAALALGWLAWHWSASATRALAGALAIALLPCAVLAFEFAILGFVARSDTTPPPSPRELFAAWWGETAQLYRVFAWRQPFRWNAIDDYAAAANGRRTGVVFIHGFACNRGFWNPWMRTLREQGIPHAAVNLEPVFGRIDDYVAIVDEAVQRVARAGGGQPPVLVCHSMGGLAARAWLRATSNAMGVDHVVTIGSPHGGTWLGRFSHSPNGDQMRLTSPWLRQLVADESAMTRRPRFTCWYSNCDNIVFPTSTATLNGADNRLVRGVGHVELAFEPRLLESLLELLAVTPAGLGHLAG